MSAAVLYNNIVAETVNIYLVYLVVQFLWRRWSHINQTLDLCKLRTC